AVPSNLSGKENLTASGRVAGRDYNTAATPAKQAKLDLTSAVQKVSEGELKKIIIAGYIVEKMLPLRMVESPSFMRILNKIPVCGKKEALPDRKTFSSYLDKCYTDMEIELKKTFKSFFYISITADIWTSHNRSFLGMTAHWIDSSTSVRGHTALACKRVRGRHTYDVIANEIEQVHSAYGLNYEVTATVTDNGSNFIKAFKMFEQSDSDEQSEEDEEVTFTDVEQALSTDSDGQFSLPPHLSCASHTLNLIFVEKWLKANKSKVIYRNAVSKCSALLTKANCSSVASELVEIFFSIKLIVLDREYLFLKEYCIVLKPLTVALDILQGEDNCYLGTLLPTLEILMSRTLALQDELRMTASLPDVIVQVGFASMMDNKEALLAEDTLPKFKLRWIREEEKKDTVRAMLTSVLGRFPRIKVISLRYNTATPSSAPVERLFSQGNLVLTPRRNRLLDKRFERLTLMRYSLLFKDSAVS
uniref:HAT C-terminal dimerisation domain-containing protein n=1 Tax=Cyprinus carpio TaxID=7962 RepID=A0A8C1V5X7_CYPCA